MRPRGALVELQVTEERNGLQRFTETLSVSHDSLNGFAVNRTLAREGRSVYSEGKGDLPFRPPGYR